MSYLHASSASLVSQFYRMAACRRLRRCVSISNNSMTRSTTIRLNLAMQRPRVTTHPHVTFGSTSDRGSFRFAGTGVLDMRPQL